MNDFVVVSTNDNGVATITLNRPDKHNAFNEQVIAELTSAFQAVGTDSAVRAVILRSEGRNFSAGADANWMKRTATYSKEDNIRDANAMARMLYELNFMPKPTIARVQGVAMGGGSGLVCCCDMAVATNDARFAFSEVKLGLTPSTITPYALKAIGSHTARRYFLTGETFDAEEAYRIGMISEVVSADNLDSRLAELIDLLLGNSSHAIAAAKQLIFDVEDKPVDEGMIQKTSESIANIRTSKDAQEGLTAFLEKRKPSWAKS